MRISESTDDTVLWNVIECCRNAQMNFILNARSRPIPFKYQKQANEQNGHLGSNTRDENEPKVIIVTRFGEIS